MEIGLWGQTHARWVSEGMPAEAGQILIKGDEFFGLEGCEDLTLGVTAPRPPFEEKVLEETGDHVLFVDGMGRTRLARVSGTVGGTRMSMDRYLNFPVTDRASFRELRRRYEGDPLERYPADWPATAERLNASAVPVVLMHAYSEFGFYSMLRNWLGTEPLSYLFYDDPGLIHECLEFLCDYIIRMLTPAVQAVRFDFVWIHEDLAGKGGPLLGPGLFREFLLPHYRRYVAFLKASGIGVVMVDTDGDFEALIPEFLEAGVDGFNPMEVAAGMDPVEMRRKWGRSFSMVGGVDKREIGKGRRAIDAQIAHIAPLVEAGGYIPWIDHTVPPEVSLADFQYYLERKKKLIFGS
jgi:uroporphyrinogen decarboxylase